MSWLSAFFRKDTVKLLMGLMGQFLKLLVGHAAESLKNIALEEVRRAESSGLDGASKYKTAYAAIVKRLGSSDFKESQINFAIEAALAIIQKELGQI